MVAAECFLSPSSLPFHTPTLPPPQTLPPIVQGPSMLTACCSFEYNHHRNPLLSELTANGQRMAEMSAVKFKEETSLYEIYENIQSIEQTPSPPRAAAAVAAAAPSPFSTPLAHRKASPMSSAKGAGDGEELQSPLVLSSPMKIASERVDLFLSHSPSADFEGGGGRGPTAASLAGDEEIEVCSYFPTFPETNFPQVPCLHCSLLCWLLFYSPL